MVLFKYFKVQKDQFVPPLPEHWAWLLILKLFKLLMRRYRQYWKWIKHEVLLYKHYPRTESSISEGNTYSEGFISCAICCSPAAIWEVPTVGCHVALSIGTSMQPQKFSCECLFCTKTAKVFPLESFAVYGISSIYNLKNFWI